MCRHPDGIYIVLWKSGKRLVWDAACLDTYAPSHHTVAVCGSGEVALQAEHSKHSKVLQPGFQVSFCSSGS